MSRFRVFGQITAGVDDEEIPLGGRRERDLLALLIAAQGRPVPADRVLSELWGQQAPASRTGSVQVAVSRLRTRLDPRRTGPSVVMTTAAGYRLAVEVDAVDVWAFDRLADRALRTPTAEQRLVVATQACDLWTGDPYAGCSAPLVRSETTRLQELFVTLQEARGQSLTELGHPAAAARLLVVLTAAHPYREELWAQLARAQYACARQADALATLATLRRRLAEDLGVDPSDCVRTMEQRILTQDRGLAAPGAAYSSRHAALPHLGRHGARVGRCRAASVTAATRVPA